jgi:hypothetical protein
VIPILNGKGIMSQAKRYVVELLVHVVFPSQREVLQDTMGIAASLRIPPQAHPAQVSNFLNTNNSRSYKRSYLPRCNRRC